MRKVSFFFVLILVVVSTAVACSQAVSFSRNPEIEKDFVIDGAFREYYYGAPDPLLLFGYPVSNVLADSSGHKRQFFQRAIFEMDVSQNQMQVVNVGYYFKETGEEYPINKNEPGCRTFANGKVVCYDFLDFYEKYDGEIYIGDPITNMMWSNDRIVQFFEKACMEWVQNNPTGETIVLRDLGTLSLQEESSRIMYPGAPSLDNGVKVKAFVAEAVVADHAQQTLYVIVQDGKFQPINGAIVNAVIKLPNGDMVDVPLGISKDGFQQVSFPVENVKPRDVVNIQVRVEYGGDGYETSTWFRVWW
jgi:hypothetical protein